MKRRRLLAGRARCTGLVAAESLRRPGRAGTNRPAFSGGRIGRRVLWPGSYEISAVAVNSAGQRSQPRRARFAIVRR